MTKNSYYYYMDFASLKLIIILLLLIKEVICFSQTSCISFGGTQNDYGYSIIQANDGNYVIAGSTSSFGSGGSDLYIAKMDMKGNLLWSKTLGGSAGNSEGAYCVIQTNDNGYIIGGSLTGGYNLYVAKLDSIGTLLWDKRIDGGGWVESIIQMQDSGYVIAGTTGSFSPGWDMYIAKLDVSGNLMWSKIYGNTDQDEDDFAYQVIQTQDGGFAIVGFSYGPSSGWYSDVNVVKLNLSGNLQWSRRIGGIGWDEGYSIIQNANGDYIISGYSDSFNPFGDDLYIAKIDSSGNLLSSMGINSFDQGWNGYSIIPTFDGGYAIGGEFFIVKLDSNDNLQWASNLSNFDVYSLIQTRDSGFAFCGNTYIWNMGFNYDIYFSKTDSSGLSCCGVADTVTFNNVVSTITAGDNITNVPSITNTGVTYIGMGVTSFVQCYQCLQPISLTILNNNTTLCQGQSVSLNVIASGGQPPYTYSWSPSTGLNNTSIANPIFTAPVFGTYTFTITVSDSTCLVQDYVYVTANLSPNVQINGNNYICIGDSTILSVNASFSYLWSTGNTTSAISVLPTTTTAYSVIVTYSNGCSNTSSYTVNVFPCNDNFQTASCMVIGGVGGTDAASKIIQTYDGGYIISGITYFSANKDIYLVKLDSIGNKLWMKTIGGSGFEENNTIIQTTDSGYAIVGSTNSFSAINGDVYILKLDISGNIQWEKIIGGTNNESAYSIIQTTNGEYVISGLTYSFGAGNADVYVMMLDASGNLQWTKTIGGAAFDWSTSLVQTNDGGYALGGNTSSFGNGQDDFYLIKLDASGNLQWTKTYGGTGDEWKGYLTLTNDGGYAMCGTSSSFTYGGHDLYVVKLDSSGNLQWTRSVGGINEEWGGYGIQTNDNGYVIIGRTKSFTNDFTGDGYLVKLDSNGNLQWTKTFGSSGLDEFGSIIQTNDNGYILAGVTFSYDMPSGDVFIVKCDSLGNSCCVSGNGGVTNSGGSVVLSGGIVNSGGGVSIANSYFSHGGIVQSACCPSPPIPIISGNTTICAGDSTTLTVSGGATYLWNTGSTDSSIVVSPTITTNYFVTTFDTNNCAGNAMVTVVVNNVNATISGFTTICTGDSTLLSVSGGILYQWSTGSTASSIYVSPTQTTTYSVMVTDAMGCIGADSITVTVNSFIIASITGDTSFCIGESTTLTASGGTMYLWSTGATSGIIIISPTSTVTYSVIVTSGSCVDSAQITVVVNTLPSVTVTGVPASCSTCCDGSASVTASGNAPFTYSWNPGGQTSSSATGLCVGNYTACATDANGCMNCDTINITFVTGTSQFATYNLQITFEPNPFSDFTTLRIKNKELEISNLEFRMYDVFGRKVKSFVIRHSPFAIFRDGLSDGMYFYEVKNGEEVFGKGKLIIQ